jgi:hypothetical protein
MGASKCRKDDGLEYICIFKVNFLGVNYVENFCWICIVCWLGFVHDF